MMSMNEQPLNFGPEMFAIAFYAVVDLTEKVCIFVDEDKDVAIGFARGHKKRYSTNLDVKLLYHGQINFDNAHDAELLEMKSASVVWE